MNGSRSDLRRWGFRRALYGLIMRRLQRHAGIQVFAVHARTFGPAPPADAVPDGHGIRYLSAADLEAACADPELHMTPAMARDAQARGDVCLGYFEHGRLVAYYWCAFGETPMEGGWWVRFPGGHIYAYKGLTLPTHRGRHLQQLLIRANERAQAGRGYHSNISYIAVHNFPSRIAAERYGNRVVGYVGFIQRFGIDTAFHTRGAKQAGFRLFRPSG